MQNHEEEKLRRRLRQADSYSAEVRYSERILPSVNGKYHRFSGTGIIGIAIALALATSLAFTSPVQHSDQGHHLKQLHRKYLSRCLRVEQTLAVEQQLQIVANFENDR